MSFRPRTSSAESRAPVPAVGVHSAPTAPSAPTASPALTMRLKQVLELGAKRDAEGNEIPDAVEVIMASTGLSKLAVKTVQGLANYLMKRWEYLNEWGEGRNLFLPGSNFDTDDLDLLKDTLKLFEFPNNDEIRQPTARELATVAVRLGLNPFEIEVFMNRLVIANPNYVPHFYLNTRKLRQLSTNPDKFQLVANTMYWYMTSFLPNFQLISALLQMSRNPVVEKTLGEEEYHVRNKIVNFKKRELQSVLDELRGYFTRISVGVFDPKHNIFEITQHPDALYRNNYMEVEEFVDPDDMKVKIKI